MALVAAWNFNEGSGSVAADSSGNGYTLTATGSPWAASGKTSSGATSGNRNVYFSRSTWTAFAAWTVSFWIRSTATANWQTCVHLATGGGGWFFEVDSSNQVGLWPAGGAIIGEASATALAANTWTHVAFTRSGSTVTIYINGVSVATSSNAVDFPASTNLLVGASGATADEYLATESAIDDLRIYNHAQSAGEITADMASAVGSTTLSTTGTLGLSLANNAGVSKSASTSGSIGAVLALTADAQKSVTRSGTLAVALALNGDTSKTSATQGALTTNLDTSGAAQKGGSTAGALPLSTTLPGVTVKSVTVVGDLGVALPMEGAGSKTGEASGSLGLDLALVATSSQEMGDSPLPSDRGTAEATLSDPYAPDDPTPSERGSANATLINPYSPDGFDPSSRGVANATLIDPYMPGTRLPSSRGATNATLVDPYSPGAHLPSARGIANATIVDPYEPGDRLPSDRGFANVTLADPYAPGSPTASPRGAVNVTLADPGGLVGMEVVRWNGSAWQVVNAFIAEWGGASWSAL